MNTAKKDTLKIVLSEGLTGAALAKFNQVSDLSVQYANTVKLLNHRFIGANALLIQQSGLVNAVHSAKFIHGLTAYNLSGWIMAVVQGLDTPCPVDVTKGIYSHPVVRFFRDNQDSIVANKTEKRLKAQELKDKKEAEKQADELARQKAASEKQAPQAEAPQAEAPQAEAAKSDAEKAADFAEFCADLERISAVDEKTKINAVLNMLKALSPEGQATIASELAAMQLDQADQADQAA